MTSSANSIARCLARRALLPPLLAGALGLAAVAHASLGATPDGSARVPEALAARVAEAVARLWGTPVDMVSLAWGRGNGSLPPSAETPFRISGRGSDGWFVIIFTPPGGSPAAIRVRAGSVDTIAVAARPLRPGSRLEPGDWRLEAKQHWGPPTRAQSGHLPAAGWQVRRAIASGEPLVSPAVAAPPLVRGGSAVTVRWERGGVRISMRGTALHDAGDGDPVRVRLDGRRDPVTGVAAGDALVRLETDGGRS
ncbi:MAG: flagellar basal body P-ring formation chaperone FlgA [Candidatus Eisenbacteria bacterium]